MEPGQHNCYLRGRVSAFSQPPSLPIQGHPRFIAGTDMASELCPKEHQGLSRAASRARIISFVGCIAYNLAFKYSEASAACS